MAHLRVRPSPSILGQYVLDPACVLIDVSVLEVGLAANASDPVLSPTYNPALLARGSALSSDISFFLGVTDDDSSWKKHKTHQALITSPPPAYQAYISRLAHIIEADPRRLLAHSYIRYLGDLSGGQIMKYNIRKAYNLTGNQGTSFYDFGALGSEGRTNPAAANMGEVRNIKQWFKNGIDAGVGNDRELKGPVFYSIRREYRGNSILSLSLSLSLRIYCTAALLEETALAYSLHKEIFDEIQAASRDTDEIKAATTLDTHKSTNMLSVSAVLTFMLAVGLAHFLIVVGGLSGSPGYAKLEAVQAWIIETIFSNPFTVL